MNSAKPVPTLTDRAIADRARSLYEAAGCIEGHDLDYWLEAEKQLRAEYARAAAEPPVASEPKPNRKKVAPKSHR